MRQPIRITVAFFMALIVASIVVLTPAIAKPNPLYASIVIDAQTGEVLRSRYADKRLHPASLTKVMTLVMLFDALEAGKVRLDTRMTASRRAAAQVPSKVGIKAGQTITVRDAIYTLVTKSANDVAVVVAEKIGGSEANFARMMTRKAREMGLRSTTFRNASGLHNRYQVTTARDMAKMARALMQYYPHYYHYFSTTNYTYKGTSYRNHNKLMRSYRGMDGLKTGYIRASGFNLIASAVRDNRRLIGVVFGGRSGATRNAHMREILDEGFATVSRRKALIVVHNNLPPLPAQKPEQPDPIGELAAVALPVVKSDIPQGDWTEASIASGGTTIQVGAFSTREAGELALRWTRRQVPQLTEAAKGRLLPLQTAQGTIYRARFDGLTPALAQTVCTQLEDCVVVEMP